MSAPRVALLTGAGRGAIASLSVVGDGAIAAVERFFLAASNRSLSQTSAGSIAFGRWGTDGGEEMVVSRVSDEEARIHCHGGSAAAERIQCDLARVGCQRATWREWSKAQGETPIQHAALEALAAARTEAAAAILLDQYEGALDRAVLRVIASLESADLENARRELAELLQWQTVGERLAAPFRLVIAGAPNVGKSSLANAILGYERAIVFDMPGTTRDVVAGETAFQGFRVEVSDTAGLREHVGEIEAEGIRRARDRMAAADLLLLVFDASAPWTERDESLRSSWPNSLVVFNKIDLKPGATIPVSAAKVSALSGQGINALMKTISLRVVEKLPPAGAAVPFTASLIAALRAAEKLLMEGKSNAAITSLKQLTSEP